jgi:hypothetical protein
MDHLEELHIPVEYAVHLGNGDSCIFQGQADRFLDHFRLVYVFPMAGVLGLPDPHDPYVSVLFPMGHRSISLFLQDDHGMVLPGCTRCAMGQGFANSIHLPLSRFSPELEDGFRGPGESPQHDGIPV